VLPFANMGGDPEQDIASVGFEVDLTRSPALGERPLLAHSGRRVPT
jgi:hypothetical protein